MPSMLFGAWKNAQQNPLELSAPILSLSALSYYVEWADLQGFCEFLLLHGNMADVAGIS